MAPKTFTTRRRDSALEHTFGETVLVMVAMSVLPLTAFVAVAFPVVALTIAGGTLGAVAGLAVGPQVFARVRSRTDDRRVCVPSTEVCIDV